MIKNKKQLAFSKSQLIDLEKKMMDMENASSDKHPIHLKLELDGLRHLIKELRLEIEEYENIVSQHLILFKERTIADLSKVLIYARIAEGISQAELARRVEIPQQQINRYEASDYESASLSRIIEIQEALGIELKIDFTIAKFSSTAKSAGDFKIPDAIPQASFCDYLERASEHKSLMVI